MTALSPSYLDYLFLLISADSGITETTVEHLNYGKFIYKKNNIKLF
jgi:GTPase